MTDNPSGAAKLKPPPKKTLVVGSSGHAHATCVAWIDLGSVNILDFDAIVFNVVSLDDETIGALPRYGFFDEVRKQLARLLSSDGMIVVLTPELRALTLDDS
jgi:hypothetical protein